MTLLDYEEAVIEKITPELKSQGYKYVRNESSFQFPKNIGNYRPDAVFVREGKFLALEIKKKRIPAIEKQLDILAKVFRADPNWDFQVQYFDNVIAQMKPKIQDAKTIEKFVKQAKFLLIEGEIRGAFLLGWASFEAASRRLFPSKFDKPQSPGRLVAILAENGVITLVQSSDLRKLINKRNALIHGSLDIALNRTEVKKLFAIVDRIQKYDANSI